MQYQDGSIVNSPPAKEGGTAVKSLPSHILITAPIEKQ
jgi:hypothetical protein